MPSYSPHTYGSRSRNWNNRCGRTPHRDALNELTRDGHPVQIDDILAAFEVEAQEA